MKKKPKKKSHRNAGRAPSLPPMRGVPRRSQRAAPAPDDPIDWGVIGATLAGAAGGALGGAFIGKHTSRVGASLVMTTGGLVGAALAHGPIRAASLSVMAVGAGQFADAIMAKPAPSKEPAKRNSYDDDDDGTGYGERRQAALPAPEPEPSPSLREALARAHAAVAVAYPDDDYAAHSFAA